MSGPSDDPEKVGAFLAELTILTRKHGIRIDGCGCCGSPFLADLREEDRTKVYVHDLGMGPDLGMEEPTPPTIDGEAHAPKPAIEGS